MRLDEIQKPPSWRSGHVWKMPEWVEPVLIVSILLSAMFFTRRRNYSLFGESATKRYIYSRIHSSPMDSPRSSISHSSSDSEPFLARQLLRGPLHPPKSRKILGLWTVKTPSSSRFAKHFHSRILQKYPFLIEMFYWVITYFFYRLTAVLAQVWYGGTKGLWDAAQGHGIGILEFEATVLGAGAANGTERWAEWRIQQWFLAGADAGDWRGVWLTVLNRCYALIHIPGTVGFIAYYYWAAPTHSRFATVRRTMSLLNLFAFLIFLLYPCMPPRLLPPEFGFIDTVNAEDAQSVWMSGKYVNALAAMPSMHFGYAFCIGCVFVYESGVFYNLLSGRREPTAGSRDLEEGSVKDGEEEDEDAAFEREVFKRRSTSARVAFLVVGVFYPSWILITIVATANHYFMDALAATAVVLVSYMCNQGLLSFLVLEDWLLWALRLEKPEPTTGDMQRRGLGLR